MSTPLRGRVIRVETTCGFATDEHRVIYEVQVYVPNTKAGFQAAYSMLPGTFVDVVITPVEHTPPPED